MSAKKSHIWWIAVAMVTLTSATADARIRYRDLRDPNMDYTQKGFQIYAGLGGQSYTIDDDDYDYLDELDSDGSFFFGLALGIDRSISLFFEGNGSEHNTPQGDMTFGYGHFGIKYAPNSGYRHLWQPYGKVSFGGVFLWEDQTRYAMRHRHEDDNGYFGPSVGLALGIDKFIGRRTALFAEVGMLSGQLDTRVINDDDYELADDIAITSGRVQFGLRFRL
ncbi:MAG: hypothetical protein AB1792_11405 [Candidatus Zixiibacteriota bacterium]